MGGDFFYKAVPVLTPHVYRQANLTNSSEYVLLPGQATMYLGTDFVGRMDLPLVAWTVNDRECQSLDEVQQVLRLAAEAERFRPAILDIAGEVPLGDMIDAYDRCRIVGIAKIQVAVQGRKVE